MIQGKPTGHIASEVDCTRRESVTKAFSKKENSTSFSLSFAFRATMRRVIVRYFDRLKSVFSAKLSSSSS